ncbi:hypothetical protein HZU75_15225 [Chitinibacter fontanus]|uniref:Uncharacterized protein n=1 Tax=Chitinibacter fontanus TaxID=1737446 RepID=A0A7D5ZAA4_9NEIS|nr:hypothetical protein [Chitinibacter fontanus]QLI82762.1 hypothetical protein HZU75_15225 [Chitinibacter fontanus]
MLKPAALPIIRSEGIGVADADAGSPFFGEAKKVSAAAHSRQSMLDQLWQAKKHRRGWRS